MSTRFLAIIYLAVGGFLLPSCETQDSGEQFKLSYRERQIIDSIFKEEVRIIGPMMDSLCSINEKEQIDHLVDSLIRQRRIEEIKLRNRNLNE